MSNFGHTARVHRRPPGQAKARAAAVASFTLAFGFASAVVLGILP
ncbi:MAG TPA: hypothetical protein VMF90_01155 [Rhizobiaceae bacterium]|nr:hypothetical protein [Rhizobiaceae bacterium]